MSRYEKKMKDKLDDEIKLAGLESLVLEELEKHLILNSNRLRTFDDARLEVVTYVEAKFGLRSVLSRLAKEKGHRVRVICVLSALEHIFDETAMHARTQASNRLARHGPKSEGKGKSKEIKG